MLRLHGGSAPPFYENNGGTVLALAGDDYAVLAADRRLSQGYGILTAKTSRLWEVSPGVWVAIAGCHADALGLSALLEHTAEEYRQTQCRPLTTEATARLLSSVLYGRRGRPYYCFCVLAGLDRKGRGAVFTFDAVGSFERVGCAAVGGPQAIALPILDDLIADPHSAGVWGDEAGETYFQSWDEGGYSDPTSARPPRSCRLSIDAALVGIKDAARAAAELDIRLGDSLQIATVVGSSAHDESLGISKCIADCPLKSH